MDREYRERRLREIAKHLKAGPNGCVECTIGLNERGYSNVGFNGKSWPAHRLFWTLAKGEIPKGLVIDHLCRNHACVNTAHLEPVTHRENVLRGDSTNRDGLCRNGHPYDGTVNRKGHRVCKACHAERSRIKYRERPEIYERIKARRAGQV